MSQNQLIEFLLGSTLVVSKSADSDTCVVKGFASTPDVDIHGEISDPNSFNWDSWPDLRVNHEKESVGRLLTINKAALGEIGSVTDWGVFDAESGEQINTYPKENGSPLKSGDVGLFVTAEVTDRETAEKAKSGKFGGFSWRGFANVFKNSLGFISDVISNIELIEISLVNEPANQQAKFVIAKSYDGDPNSIFDDPRIMPTYESEEVQKGDDSNGLGSGLGNDPELSTIFPPFLR